MKTSEFNYYLPENLIAQTPAPERDHSRLMTVSLNTDLIEHRHFFDLPEYITDKDCIIFNNSRVMPARLIGYRETGGTVEVLLLRDLGDNRWECLTKPGRKTHIGSKVLFGDGKLRGTVIDIVEGGKRIIEFDYEGIFLEIIEELGRMPLPPYIKEQLDDPERYQTVYSKELGSAAAPTAGLHFTEELIDKLKAKGVKVGFVTLHVGLGTFRPVKEDEIEDHEMHSEFCFIPAETAEIINSVKREGGRVFAVGTTTCRTLESFADEDGHITEASGWTDIFIYPGYRFKCIDALITNFHLPESSLIMLVSALAGREKIMNAYELAVREQYRFFSFGDAMLLY